MRAENSGLLLAAVLALSPAAVPAQNDSTWQDHDLAGREARNRGDWASARVHAERMDVLLNGHPRVALGIARASAHLGDIARVLELLDRVADMGIFFDVAADSEFTSMAGVIRAQGVDRRFRDNRRTIGTISVVGTILPDDFIAEGIAYDPARKRFLVSSIRYGKVVSVSRDGVVRDYIDLRRDGGWAGLGLAVDSARNRLWVTTSRTARTVRTNPADSVRAGVMLYDLAAGRMLKIVEFPRGNHEPGDVCLAPNGDLYVSNGRTSEIYAIRASSDSLQVIVPRGRFVSPQGCAISSDGGRLFVADYALGISSVNLVTGGVELLPRSRHVALNGIDGLVRHGNLLIGIQNGVQPNRVISMQLDRDGAKIGSVRVLAQDSILIHEPTHLTRVGNDVVFVANGGFDAFDQNGQRRANVQLRAPRIGRVSLAGARGIRPDMHKPNAPCLQRTKHCSVRPQ